MTVTKLVNKRRHSIFLSNCPERAPLDIYLSGLKPLKRRSYTLSRRKVVEEHLWTYFFQIFKNGDTKKNKDYKYDSHDPERTIGKVPSLLDHKTLSSSGKTLRGERHFKREQNMNKGKIVLTCNQ